MSSRPNITEGHIIEELRDMKNTYKMFFQSSVEARTPAAGIFFQLEEGCTIVKNALGMHFFPSGLTTPEV